MTRAARLVPLAVVLLALGWALAPRAALPLYDGVGFPDEPYRFVAPPAGAPHTKAPTVASVTAALPAGQNSDINAASGETAPQIIVQIVAGDLLAPSGTRQVTVTATPVRPLPAPAQHYLWSNVYDIAVAPDSMLKPGPAQAILTLRAATAQQPQPQIERYQSGQWVSLPTYPVGRDVYEVQLTAFGRYAVIGSEPLDVSTLIGAHSSSAGGRIGIAVGGGVLVVLVTLFVLGRRRRARVRREEAA